ncbi:MAG: TetR/AcrR family transcriptional regulator [Oscillospiraceae bacterium]|jgi:AcrR family transcriptional regulator
MRRRSDDIKNRILEEAKKELLENGYAGLTMRSVAENSHVATGTTYNYFPSKNAMIVEVLDNDWMELLDKVRVISDKADTVDEVARAEYEALCEFCKLYRGILTQLTGSYWTQNFERNHSHRVLVRELADLLLPAMERMGGLLNAVQDVDAHCGERAHLREGIRSHIRRPHKDNGRGLQGKIA